MANLQPTSPRRLTGENQSVQAIPEERERTDEMTTELTTDNPRLTSQITQHDAAQHCDKSENAFASTDKADFYHLPGGYVLK